MAFPLIYWLSLSTVDLFARTRAIPVCGSRQAGRRQASVCGAVCTILGGSVSGSTEDIAELIARIALGDRAGVRAPLCRDRPETFRRRLAYLEGQGPSGRCAAGGICEDLEPCRPLRRRRSEPDGWLVAIARNHAIDILRAQPHRPGRNTSRTTRRSGPDPGSYGDRGVGTRPARRLPRQTRSGTGRRAVARAYVEGYSYRNWRSVTTVPLNTMRTWLRRGLIKLRECLEA